MSAPTPPKAPVPATIPPEVVAQLIASQTRQLDLREKEIELQRVAAETERKKVENAQEYALRALAAQAEDRKDERQHQAKNTRYGFWVSLLLLVGLIGLTGYAMYANKDQLILEVIKAIVFAGGGGGIGYVLGFKKGEKAAGPPGAPPNT